MRGEKRNGAGAARWADSATARNVALCLGFGCYLSYYPVGTVGTPLVTLFAGSDLSLLIARSVYFAAFVIIMLLWKVARADDLLHRIRLATLSFVGANLAFVVLFLLDAVGQHDMGLFTYAALLGIATATPALGWYEGFLDVYRTQGKAACVIVLAACSLVSVAAMPFLAFLSKTPVLLVVALVLVNVSGVCHAWLGRLALPILAVAEGGGTETPSRGEARDGYRPSVYICVVMATSGFVWFMSYSFAAHVGFGHGLADPNTWGILCSGVVVNAVLIAVFGRVRGARRSRFGMLLRYIVAITGAAWAFMPLIAHLSSACASFLCAMTYLLLMTNMILLNVELCYEHGLSVCCVSVPNYLLYIAGGAVGTVLFALVSIVENDWVFYTLVSGSCIAALLASLPFLPSIGSSATDFARSRLPETESAEARIASEKELLIASKGLTAREAEVLDLLLAGCSREEIAERLALSPHTVKNHATSIYRKLGVHSNHELAALVMGFGEPGER